jgi:anti-sigma regulatory factor (Ser/Thr protein kinase)
MTFSMASEPGNEREAMERIASAVPEQALGKGREDKLKTAVAEAMMNAMEHGDGYDATKNVQYE